MNILQKKTKIHSVIDKVNAIIPLSSVEHQLKDKKTNSNKVLIFCWLFALLAAAIILNSYSLTSKKFFGIAVGSEKIYNFQYPVEIVDVLVTVGEQVNKGDVLIEVQRYDLAENQSITEEKIAELTARKYESSATIKAKIKQLEAQEKNELSDLEIQLSKVNSELALKLAWKKNNLLSSIPTVKNILQVKKDNLLSQQKNTKLSYQAIVDNLREQLNNTTLPIDAKISVLLQRKEELIRQAKSLVVIASFSGRISHIHFTQGEQVKKFSPILVLQGESPTYAKAYIHETIAENIVSGQKVWIQSVSSNNNNHTILAEVESLGKSIVEYPERLKRSSSVSAWGREIVVKFKDKHQILSGEKIMVLTQEPKVLSMDGGTRKIFQQLTAMLLPKAQAASIHDLVDIKKMKSKYPIEASGIVWDEYLEHYWLISDEDNALFKVNIKGNVNNEIKIKGFKITDAESISIDGNNLYVLASLSTNKSQENKKKRQKFIHFIRKNDGWKLQHNINLYAVLAKAKDLSTIDSTTRLYINQFITNGSLDVEAHYITGNQLFIGIKSPLSGQQSVILKVDDVEQLLLGNITHVDIFKQFKLISPDTQHQMTISDMIFYQDKIYLLAVNVDKPKNNSALWELSSHGENITMLKQFSGLKAEGLAINTLNSTMMIVFDEGSKSIGKQLDFPLSNIINAL
jgi:multidrug resistance efflux pump